MLMAAGGPPMTRRRWIGARCCDCGVAEPSFIGAVNNNRFVHSSCTFTIRMPLEMPPSCLESE